MPAKRLSMRKVKEILRLKWGQGLSNRKFTAACGISRPTVSEYLRRAEEADLSWPLPGDLTDTHVEQLLFPPPPVLPAQDRGIPNWLRIHQELKRKGVTLFLLWQEYRGTHPHGYQYSWFCGRYREWRGKLDVVMHPDHRAGEKLFVDYAGQKVPIIDRTSGEIKEAEIFVAVMGASNYTFAKATWSRSLILSSYHYQSIETTRKHRLDEKPLEEQQVLSLTEDHDNIHGPSYYHSPKDHHYIETPHSG